MNAGFQNTLPGKNIRAASTLLVLALQLAPYALAQQAPSTFSAPQAVLYNPDDFRVSYAYAAVMGSGTYKIDGREISQLRIPFKLTQRKMTEDQSGMQWYAPVSVGYDGVTDNNWLDKVFEDDLVTLTLMPGFLAQIPLNDTWTIKPFGEVGVTRDFTRNETIVLGSTGMRTRATWRLNSVSELRWGVGLKLVGEYQTDSNFSNGFTILETGLDYRRDTDLWLFENEINAGVYYHFQHFTPLWDITDTPLGDSDVNNLYEVGLSVGLKRPRKFWRITVDRVRMGYKYGSGLKGFTIGGDFPI